jgi:hypothetical protein
LLSYILRSYDPVQNLLLAKNQHFDEECQHSIAIYLASELDSHRVVYHQISKLPRGIEGKKQRPLEISEVANLPMLFVLTDEDIHE